jgi:hypothetical protein
MSSHALRENKNTLTNNAEAQRLEETRSGVQWRKWGPYLSERQWGTVREDYSLDGDAWNYFTHDQARSRAYRWGEDGLAGFSDEKQRLCFALALWNGRDPILKERLFGLTNTEANHGEDVKEYYFYLDNTPTHSYMKYLYKYPQAVYPYADIVETNRRRSRHEVEYELIDTGVFNDDRYFDVFVEYAKAAPEDTLIKLTVCNRGPEEATLHVLATLWFRNTWSWHEESPKPSLYRADAPKGAKLIRASHAELGEYLLHCEGEPQLLFTENETNFARVFGTPNKSAYVKDAFHRCLIDGQADAVNPAAEGTKAAAHYILNVGPGKSAEIRLRLAGNAFEDPAKRKVSGPFGPRFNELLRQRLQETDEFYRSITPASVSRDAANVMRQALAGMLWTKQYYGFDGDQWLKGHGVHPLLPNTRYSRNHAWFHMVNDDIISMPDKWEFPWYATWDLAFQTLPLSLVDIDFAKEQLSLMLCGRYLHPNGQLPAYEWNFSDVNPPVHAWAALFLHRTEMGSRGEPDLNFLKGTFNKLLLNFTWWVNRKDRFGKNVFEGGFLGLDNIGVFDRSATLPMGGHLEQADATAWMALFAQNMCELAVDIAAYDPVYEEMVFKFLDHLLYIASAMNLAGQTGMWDEEDGFYYDLLRLPDGSAMRLKVRSLVGLLPLCATTVIEPWQRDRVPKAAAAFQARLGQMPDLMDSFHPTGPGHLGVGGRGIIALVNPERLRRILWKMLDEDEFLSPYGIRSMSKFHEQNPYVLRIDSREYRVGYLPAESDSGMFGGNSNWRGPVWFPMNAMIIRALQNFYLYYGGNFQVECPTGSGNMMNLYEVSKEIAERLTRIFLRDESGRRPVYGTREKFQNDPNWKDYILCHEYFHGDNGVGLGASHQTGWTGLVAKLIESFGRIDATRALEIGKKHSFATQELAGSKRAS